MTTFIILQDEVGDWYEVPIELRDEFIDLLQRGEFDKHLDKFWKYHLKGVRNEN